MADIVKMKMHKKCDKGGLHCYCCNSWTGKGRKTLSRMIRRMVKAELKKELSEA